MATLPPALQQQVDESEALYAQMQQQGESPQADTQETSHVESALPEIQVAQQAPPVQPAADKSSEATWEQRYRTLQGIHNANASDFRRRVEQLTSENNELSKRLAQLEQAQIERESQQDTDPKFRESFGDEMVDMVQSVVDARIKRSGAKVDSKIENIDRKLSSATQETAQTADNLFIERLSARVPNLVEANQNPAFLDWLAQPDPIYGLPRQTALDAAAQSRDVDRTARIFEMFLQQQPAPKGQNAKQELAKQVAPRAGYTGPTLDASGKRRYSSDEVTRLYDLKRRGGFKDEDWAATERDINQALVDGRITG
jgi:hypothetical protein